MKYVKWIFVVLLIYSLTAFVGKDKSTKGLNEGDVAPDFRIETTTAGQPAFDLTSLRGRYVLISFWAGYDARSRMLNASLSDALSDSRDVAMVSVSFDPSKAVFEETIRKDRIDPSSCFVDTKGEDSGLFREYRLDRGFTNYLLDKNGVIVAKDISTADLSAYVEKLN
ncbi:MAG: redoxin domain-containing protein [Mediterranea sp.]|jgi:peroxiredoxin|nr:redoxin domain-containing protein [Mediterranea sp.]